jgi:hypothetical protein
MATRKVRVGFRPDISRSTKIEVEPQIQGGRRQKTSLQRARGELIEALNEYQNASDVLKREVVGEATRLDTIINMHMPTLAAVMMYLRDYPAPDPEDFTDEILEPYLDRLMQNYISPPKATTETKRPTRQEQREVRHQYKQTMLRYILKVLKLRQDERSGREVAAEEEETPENGE